jgi:ribosomal protein S18 acetylase RimI-like enzyme
MRIRQLTSDDKQALNALLRRVSLFEPHDIRVAEELIDEHLSGNPDYLIAIAEEEADRGDAVDGLAGFVCYGHNPVTDAIHDVYWIAVHPDALRRGIGRALLAHVEQRVRDLAGRAITIETSCRPEYDAARGLYEACGYSRVAEIQDFYKPGDAMRTYMKFV